MTTRIVRIARYARCARFAQIVPVRRSAYGVLRGEVRHGAILFVGGLMGRMNGGNVVCDASRFDVSDARGIARLAAVASGVGAVDRL